MHLLSLFLFISLFSIANAETVTLPSNQEINFEVYGKNSAKHKVLWIHSERGIRDGLQRTLLEISMTQDIQIFLPD